MNADFWRELGKEFSECAAKFGEISAHNHGGHYFIVGPVEAVARFTELCEKGCLALGYAGKAHLAVDYWLHHIQSHQRRN